MNYFLLLNKYPDTGYDNKLILEIRDKLKESEGFFIKIYNFVEINNLILIKKYVSVFDNPKINMTDYSNKPLNNNLIKNNPIKNKPLNNKPLNNNLTIDKMNELIEEFNNLIETKIDEYNNLNNKNINLLESTIETLKN